MQNIESSCGKGESGKGKGMKITFQKVETFQGRKQALKCTSYCWTFTNEST